MNHRKELLGAALIALFFFLGDYFAAHQAGYTIRSSVATIRDMSVVSSRTGVAGQSRVGIAHGMDGRFGLSSHSQTSVPKSDRPFSVAQGNGGQ